MSYEYVAIFLVALNSAYCLNSPFYVCNSFEDYYTNTAENEHCYFEPDIYLKVPQIIERHGYHARTYRVTTADGYILTVFRIPTEKKTNKPPVFLQHGIGISSASFVSLRKHSLAFLLADRGYDVWLGNFRGSSYSDKHVKLQDNNRTYWNFSFHENGVYDLPAQLDLVQNKTGKKVLYVGFSMGTTAFFVFNSEFPQLARERVQAMVALAPIAYMNKITTPLRLLAPFWPLAKSILYRSTDGALNQRTPTSFTVRLLSCLPYPNQMETCRLFAYLLFGYDPPQIDPETLPITLMQNFEASSIKTLDHYIQLITSGGFLKYDYGRIGNLRTYGTSKPPPYNLTNVNLPIYLIRSENDLLGTKGNVEQLTRALPAATKVSPVYVVNDKEFSHADFITAKDVETLLYDHVIDILDNASSNSN